MTAKFIVGPMERSLPTSVAYRSDRITSFHVEADLELADSEVQAIRARQLADLDAQEAVLRTRFAMERPETPEEQVKDEAAIAGDVRQAAASLKRPSGDFQTADRVAREAATRQSSADAIHYKPRDVTDESADELRRLALRLTDLGHPHEGPMPSSEADAQALLPKLRAKVYDLTKATTKPALTTTKDPGFVMPDGQQFRPGHGVAAWERKCPHKDHGSKPMPITIAEWNDSHKAVGRALCTAHLQAAAKRGA